MAFRLHIEPTCRLCGVNQAFRRLLLHFSPHYMTGPYPLCFVPFGCIFAKPKAWPRGSLKRNCPGGGTGRRT